MGGGSCLRMQQHNSLDQARPEHPAGRAREEPGRDPEVRRCRSARVAPDELHTACTVPQTPRSWSPAAWPRQRAAPPDPPNGSCRESCSRCLPGPSAAAGSDYRGLCGGAVQCTLPGLAHCRLPTVRGRNRLPPQNLPVGVCCSSNRLAVLADPDAVCGAPQRDVRVKVFSLSGRVQRR